MSGTEQDLSTSYIHDRHELDGVVAELLDARQGVLGELGVGPHSRLRRADADCRETSSARMTKFFQVWSARSERTVSFVHLGRDRLGRARVLEAIRVGRVPEAGVVNGRDVEVLSDALDPSWQSVDALAVALDHRDLCGCASGTNAFASSLAARVWK